MTAAAEPFLAIVNPAAGGGRAGRLARPALAALQGEGLVGGVLETSTPGEATRFAAEAWSRGVRRFLAVGGDGTSFEVLNGLLPAPAGARGRPVLAHLPLGTGNSFLRDFGIRRAEEAVDALRRGATRVVDVVRVEHADGTLHYLNLLSTGFSARAGALTNLRFKRLGAAGYVVAVVSCVVGLEHPVLPIRLDDGPVDLRPSVLLSFSNSRYTAGTMCMAPMADPSDGELDVIRVGPLGRLTFLGAFPAIFEGRHVERPDVEQTRARRVVVDPVGVQDVMVDGEVLRLDLRSLEVVPGAIEVVA